jgi:transketolase
MSADYRLRLAYQGPVYIRLDGKALPELLDESYRFVPGAVLTLREGEDVALVATGSTVHEMVEAAQQLADLGIQAKVVSVPSIRPCDTAALLAALKPCGSVITVEEHNVNGGWAAWWRRCWRKPAWAFRSALGIPDGEYAAAADRGWMRQYHGFDAAAIVALVQKWADGLNARRVKRGRLLLQCAKRDDVLLRRYPVQG